MTAEAQTTTAPELDLSAGGQGWRPKKGDEVRGILRGIDKGWSDWTGSFYPILNIERDDGSFVAVHCFHSVLLNKVKTKKPLPGEYVGVAFLGKEKTKDGKREVHLYGFDVSRPEGESSDPYAEFPDPERSETPEPVAA